MITGSLRGLMLLLGLICSSLFPECALYWRVKDVLHYDDDHLFTLGSFVRDCSSLELLGCKMSEAYLYYFGLCHWYCFKDKMLTYRNRYKHPAYTYSSIELIESRHYYFIQNFFNFFMRFTAYQVESVTDEDADFVRDFYNNLSFGSEVN